MKPIFIDGSSGTTGLRIHDRLRTRNDIEILEIPDELRKDNDARKKFFNAQGRFSAKSCFTRSGAREVKSIISSKDLPFLIQLTTRFSSS